MHFNLKFSHLQCEVVEISDDEDSFVLENDAGMVPKDESLNYDLPPRNTWSRPEPVWLLLVAILKQILQIHQGL